MSPKQTRFVSEYMIDLNATKAAIRAGYSKRTAQQQGSRLLLNVVVCAEIAKLQNAILLKNLVKADDVIQELARMAFFDVRNLFYPDGSMIPIHKLDRNTAAGIAGFELMEVVIPNRLLRGIRILGRLEGMHHVAKCLGQISEKDHNKKLDQFAQIYASILDGMKG